MINELKNTPIMENQRFKSIIVDYEERKAYYQQHVVAQIKIDRNNSACKEKLVDCHENGLMCKNYYYFSPVLSDFPEAKKYLSKKVMLRKSVVSDLAAIDEKIKNYGLRLFVLSGYRHINLQEIILKAVSKLKGENFANKMLANPDHHAPHATGAAFDIEIWSEKDKKLLSTKFKKGFGRYDLEQLKTLTIEEKAVRESRRLIHNLLSTDCILNKKNVFIPHPVEYWHYGRNEKLSKFFIQNDEYPVFYDTV